MDHQALHYFACSGAISARLSTDAAQVKSIVGVTLSLAVQNLATIVAALVIAFSANWQLALVILALVPLLGLQGRAQIKFMKGFSADAKVRNAASRLLPISSLHVLCLSENMLTVPCQICY